MRHVRMSARTWPWCGSIRGDSNSTREEDVPNALSWGRHPVNVAVAVVELKGTIETMDTTMQHPYCTRG